MSIQFEFWTAPASELESYTLGPRIEEPRDPCGYITIGEGLDPATWLDRFEEARDTVLARNIPRLQRNGDSLVPASETASHPVVVPDRWVSETAALDERQQREIVRRWAWVLGEAVSPDEVPATMLEDLQKLVQLCQCAVAHDHVVLFRVDY